MLTALSVVFLWEQANGMAISLAAGFVGQAAAREAAGLVVDMIRQKKMAGRSLQDGASARHCPGARQQGLCFQSLLFLTQISYSFWW
jgi:hypothetical protein